MVSPELDGSMVSPELDGFIAAAPVRIHSGPLQPRPEWGGMLEPGGAGPRPESSFRRRLFRASAGRHQTSDDGRSLACAGYEAGDRIVPSRQPGAGASWVRSAAAARLEKGAVIAAIAVTDDLGFRPEHRSDPSRPSPAWVRPSSTNLGESAFQGNPLVSDPPELRGIDRAVRDQAHERISTRMSGNLFN